MKPYISYTIKSTDEEILGLLSRYDFEAFEERDEDMIGYIAEDVHTDRVRQEIEETLTARGVAWSTELIQPRNWNAEWEANFTPVVIDQFCVIRADFHPADPTITHDIIINPKMAFGTGHHETTHMMVSEMAKLDHKSKRVLDYGCGTGVLAILASRLEASSIDAIDIEEESYLNTIENSTTNQVTNITPYHGTLDLLLASRYEVILANINRQVLLDSASDLAKMLEPDGSLLLSGILVEDVQKITDAYAHAGLAVISHKQRGNWMCLTLRHQ